MTSSCKRDRPTQHVHSRLHRWPRKTPRAVSSLLLVPLRRGGLMAKNLLLLSSSQKPKKPRERETVWAGSSDPELRLLGARTPRSRVRTAKARERPRGRRSQPGGCSDPSGVSEPFTFLPDIFRVTRTRGPSLWIQYFPRPWHPRGPALRRLRGLPTWVTSCRSSRWFRRY